MEITETLYITDRRKWRAWLEKKLAPLNLKLEDFIDGPLSAPGSVDVAFAGGVFHEDRDFA